jgi:fructokinase
MSLPRSHVPSGLAREGGVIEMPAPAVDVVDTIGAGDSFQAGLLFALRAMGRISAGPLARMSAHELNRALAFAAACAAFTCGRPGADPPRRARLTSR